MNFLECLNIFYKKEIFIKRHFHCLFRKEVRHMMEVSHPPIKDIAITTSVTSHDSGTYVHQVEHSCVKCLHSRRLSHWEKKSWVSQRPLAISFYKNSMTLKSIWFMNVLLRTILSKHGNFIFISIMWFFFFFFLVLIYRRGFPHKLWKSVQWRQLLSGRKY